MNRDVRNANAQMHKSQIKLNKNKFITTIVPIVPHFVITYINNLLIILTEYSKFFDTISPTYERRLTVFQSIIIIENIRRSSKVNYKKRNEKKTYQQSNVLAVFLF